MDRTKALLRADVRRKFRIPLERYIMWFTTLLQLEILKEILHFKQCKIIISVRLGQFINASLRRMARRPASHAVTTPNISQSLDLKLEEGQRGSGISSERLWHFVEQIWGEPQLSFLPDLSNTTRPFHDLHCHLKKQIFLITLEKWLDEVYGTLWIEVRSQLE